MSDKQKAKISASRIGKYGGKNNPKWRGGIYINKGYKYIFKPEHPNSTVTGYVLEHRFVMEQKLGRHLAKGETVHHLNHDTLDNRIENLHLCTSTGKHFVENHLKTRDELGRFKESSKAIRRGMTRKELGI